MGPQKYFGPKAPQSINAALVTTGKQVSKLLHAFSLAVLSPS